MALLSAGLTDIGRKRSTNQDSIYLNPDINFFLVADGMGGHSGGDVASQLSVKKIPEYVLNHLSSKSPAQVLNNAIKFANEAIYQKSQEMPKLKGMGTTAVSLYFFEDTLYIGNVGDSRAYLVHNTKLYQLSKDHSLVQEKLNLGIYDRQKAADDPMKNVLVRSVGHEDHLVVDVFSYKICRHDFFLLCSDGLHGKVSDSDMLFLINKHIPTPAQATQQDLDNLTKALVDTANGHGGQDNISVVIVLAQ
ncbi:MAG: Stp1/IreP family PP2C-type Ser/Thr phosphatase [Bacteriovoracaceae bacterium]|nr:Stp1/IreP family PP2C-type Ser/Thr phosphatase [Bacteriovoracaceae bacterium]